jgi:hypothetical protein
VVCGDQQALEVLPARRDPQGLPVLREREEPQAQQARKARRVSLAHRLQHSSA